jgi:hypothetical protein
MTLNDLLERYVTDCTDPVDINVEDPSTGSFYFIPGDNGRIPAKIRNRRVSHFTVDTCEIDGGKTIPILEVTVMAEGA